MPPQPMIAWPMWMSSVAEVPNTCTPSSAWVVGGDQQLEHAVVVADDLAARELAVARDADLVGDGLLGELGLGGADSS